MIDQPLGDDLASEIALIQQELCVKKVLLDDSRQKLQAEIAEHKITKSNLAQKLNENEELRTQLEVNLKAAQNLELENVKTREIMVNLQVQTNTYMIERQLLLNRCYDTELENNRLKDEVTELKEQLKAHQGLQENYRFRHLETESLVKEILSKQEVLKKEQGRLEVVGKEGLSFAMKVSEEAKYQAKFVLEANASRIKMEEEMIRLITTLKKLKNERKTNPMPSDDLTENGDYIKEWKDTQREHKERINDLLQENERLMEELTLATSQIELLLNKKDNLKPIE